MVLLKIDNGQLKGWIEGSNTHEIRRNLESIIDYNDNFGRQQCIQQLYQMDFPSQGKHDLGNGYCLLVS